MFVFGPASRQVGGFLLLAGGLLAGRVYAFGSSGWARLYVAQLVV